MADMLSRAALACRIRMELPLVNLSAASVHHGQAQYRIDQRLGPIVLAVEQRALFSLRGELARFTCTLEFDRTDPLDVRIDMTLDATSIALPGWDALTWRPLAPWFELAAHPTIRFRSTAVTPSGADRYAMRGLLTIGGVTRIQVLDATQAGRHADPITGTEVADLLIKGSLSCSDFGMPPGQALISDQVELVVRARIELET
jgi:polyisoprenoid-binding protein YceI